MNILFITTDQQHPRYIGYDSPAVDTPNLDALAARGTIFDRSYSSSPTCTPSRATWLTGQYPFTHGAWQIGTSLAEDVVTLPGILAEHGYRTAIFGKSHLQSCSPNGGVRPTLESPPTSLDTDSFRDWQGPWYGFAHAEINVGHLNEEHAACMHYRAWLEDHGVDIDRYFQAYCDGDSSPGVWDLPLEHHPSVWATDRALAYLDADDDRPFYINLNYPEPHRPFKVPEPYYSMFRDAEPPAPIRRWNEWEDKGPLHQSIADGSIHEAGVQADPSIRVPAVADGSRYRHKEYADRFSDEELERVRVYLGMLKLVDDQVGRIVRRLDERGLTDDTLIVFTSDHGDFLGDHFVWSKGTLHYDGGTRVPIFFGGPGVMAERRYSGLFSNVDFAPTFLDFLGLSVPLSMKGHGFGQVLRGEPRTLRHGLLVDFRAEANLYVASWITQRFRLTFTMGPSDQEYELYDLKNDPNEFINLAGNEDGQSLVRELTAQMLAERLFCLVQDVAGSDFVCIT